MNSIFNSLTNKLDSYGRSVKINHTGMTAKTSASIIAKHPGKVPVVVMKRDGRINLKKNKYLVPCDLTMGQMAYVLRKHSDGLDPSESLFIFISDGKVLAPSSSTMGLLHDQYKSDGFLKIEVCLENTFG
tara:strand:- start:120 stop:509 length:390 start_codon:yes stop_codon:yes gene_type:complete